MASLYGEGLSTDRDTAIWDANLCLVTLIYEIKLGF